MGGQGGGDQGLVGVGSQKAAVLPEGIHRDIEVITDMWGRPRVRLSGAIAEHLKEVTIHLSLTHEADTAAAVAVLEER